ncbi:MAG: amylo-alpha-1,6-glucosidase [Polyangia bacterium]
MSDVLRVPWTPGTDPRPLREREWLVTNGLGGYASCTLLGVLARSQHGMFVPNLVEPRGRHVMLGMLDEEIAHDHHLVGIARADESLEGHAHEHLVSFTLHRGVPTWRYTIDDRMIERTLVMPHARNTLCVVYRLVSGPPLPMRLRPYGVFRRIDEPLLKAGDRTFVVEKRADHYTLALADHSLALDFGVSRGTWVHDERDRGEAMYLIDRDRGYPDREATFSPGYLDVELRDSLTFCATMETWLPGDLDGEAMIASEHARKAGLLALVEAPLRDGFAAELVCAADQFIARPGARMDDSGEDFRTVMAGYPWFLDWGRDTMISLEGLTLTTGREREAGAILRTFARYVADGLLPNLFPEGKREGLYNTVDATLWYFHAIERYRRASGDETIIRELYPTLVDIVAHHVRGTRFGIGVSDDGLLHAGAPGYQLTWMDAKVGDWVVTPRRGKPVEIQALWFNALCLLASWSESLGESSAELRARAGTAQQSFERRFPNDTGGLHDLVDAEDPVEAVRCRPNQIFAISLDHPILSRDRWASVLGVVERELLTPYGLRTLSPRDPAYKRTYEGDLRSRDAAYHQGTVWPWLIGHFIDASLKVHADKARVHTLLETFPAHLFDAGLGSISEIFDAETPYTPRGCIAQAWSVAEVLRAWALTR